MSRTGMNTDGTCNGSIVLDGMGKLHEPESPTTPWDFSGGVVNIHKGEES